MQVILLERIGSLGQMGDIVKVKDGYARNFLLPQGKALRATERNKDEFSKQRVQLEARNLEAKSEAEAIAEKLDGQHFVAIRQAGDTGQLYGSVSTRDIAEVVSSGGFHIDRRQIALQHPIKALGIHPVGVSLHPEVTVSITMNVARSEDEAERQARGEDVTVIQDDAFELETFNPDADPNADYEDNIRAGDGSEDSAAGALPTEDI
ncbi:MAG: 50S ribosomal protein L9 [Hyphomicrobiaceae bacterium]